MLCRHVGDFKRDGMGSVAWVLPVAESRQGSLGARAKLEQQQQQKQKQQDAYRCRDKDKYPYKYPHP